MTTPPVGHPPASQWPLVGARVETADATWTWLYRIAGAAALISVGLLPVAIVVYAFNPPPSTVADWFAQFQANWLVGLIDLDLVMLIDSVLMIPIFLAFYVALRRSNESFMALGTTVGLVGVVVYITTNPSFSMLSLSQQYVAATTDAQRAMLLAAGQALLTTWQGTAFSVSYVFGGLAGLMIAIVMLRSTVFGRAPAYVGVVLNALLLVPPTVGSVGVVLAFLSLVPLAIWQILIARRLLQLGQGATR